jgi:hypothetical protein
VPPSGRRVQLSALAAGVALALSAVVAPGSAIGSVAPAATTPPPAAAPPIELHLSLSTRDPRQLRGVMMHATSDDTTIVLYLFEYGDGTHETTAQPLASHGYARPGTYHAKVFALDRAGRFGESSPVTIHVRDGVPPTVSIDTPRPNAHFSLRPGGVTLKGRASDAGGVHQVQLAIELVSSKTHFPTHGGCVWYDPDRPATPRAGLVLSGCQAPVYFSATFAHGRWQYRIPSGASLASGTYVARVRASDRAGNVSAAFSEQLHTLIPFGVTG